MGAHHSEALDRAADLGIALQMTNIARDVMDDAATGRIYLPLDWMEAEGVPPPEIREGRHRAPLARIVRRFLGEADRYYASARFGLRYLSTRSAWSIATASRIYRDIGRLVLRRGERAWDRRAVVGRGRKLARVARGALDAITAKTVGGRVALPPRQGLWTRPRAQSEF
jgi:phytoene synthase